MSDDTDKKHRDERDKPEPAKVRKAKGAALEAIGKLLGDDQAVRDGRNEQRHAARHGDDDGATPSRPRRDTNPKQEQE
ncbi:hypothetical protein KZ810_16410 [Sphingomonas sp. RHCKR47]|uniref:hypothetical protein n=1 Tax=Sphingomonas citricola TaxID=2862498 RepID=UPI001CA52F75|nr:hypothetical protein [Sphingomonas citricola]MBW6525080.1 hypothetical protein [Sphingomonas citricola]